MTDREQEILRVVYERQKAYLAGFMGDQEIADAIGIDLMRARAYLDRFKARGLMQLTGPLIENGEMGARLTSEGILAVDP